MQNLLSILFFIKKVRIKMLLMLRYILESLMMVEGLN